ncbi:MAG: hypothetical protein H6818_05085 [Phycisphaerales bacterium]|nr:hypothetical protein [Phycisphaerales bacterium]MCB9863441.1 hypothetical protein [Phycisphaerales bacterium]
MGAKQKEKVEHYSTKLLRRLFPVSPDDVLTDDELREIEPEVKAYKWRLWIIGGFFILAGSLGLTLALRQAYKAITEPVVNPVIDERADWFWAFPSIAFVLSVGLIVEVIYGANINPRLGDKVHRYDSTKNRWNSRRAALFSGILMICFAGFLGIASYNICDVVDENGLHFSSGFGLVRKSYPDVKEIGLYESFRAPIGERDVTNLRILFADGEQQTYLAEEGKSIADLVEIANYVSKRSGVEITRGRKRPEP